MICSRQETVPRVYCDRLLTWDRYGTCEVKGGGRGVEYSLWLGQLTPFTPYTVKVSMRPGVEGALHCTGPLKSVPPILGRLQAAPCDTGRAGRAGRRWGMAGALCCTVRWWRGGSRADPVRSQDMPPSPYCHCRASCCTRALPESVTNNL